MRAAGEVSQVIKKVPGNSEVVMPQLHQFAPAPHLPKYDCSELDLAGSAGGRQDGSVRRRRALVHLVAVSVQFVQLRPQRVLVKGGPMSHHRLCGVNEVLFCSFRKKYGAFTVLKIHQ